MPQEMQVLRCYKCEHFQVHIVKKVSKWECKICFSKQSVKKVYDRGSGKQCRLQVQKLNLERVNETPTGPVFENEYNESEVLINDVINYQVSNFVPNVVESNVESKWAQFLDDKAEPITDDEDEINVSCNIPKESMKRAKRQKRKCQKSDKFDTDVEVNDYRDKFNNTENKSDFLQFKTKKLKRNELSKWLNCTSKENESYEFTETENCERLNQLKSMKYKSDIEIKQSKHIENKPKELSKWVEYTNEESESEEECENYIPNHLKINNTDGRTNLSTDFDSMKNIESTFQNKENCTNKIQNCCNEIDFSKKNEHFVLSEQKKQVFDLSEKDNLDELFDF